MKSSPARLLVGGAVAAALVAGSIGQVNHVSAAKHVAANTCVPDPKDGSKGPYPASKSADCTGLKAVTVNLISAPIGGAFAPSNITIKKGTKVTWVWKNIPHNVAPFHNNVEAKVGYSFSMTFSKTGNFSYKCTIHPGMNGLVIVK